MDGVVDDRHHLPDLQLWVELRGFEPLTPSMRTTGTPVDEGRGTSSESFARSAPGRSLVMALLYLVVVNGVQSMQRMLYDLFVECNQPSHPWT